MTPELLAPAGGPEAVRAAVCAGADAIYLGAAAFGARATAGFSPEELRTAIRFAHFHGRKIYVTVNTLVKDGEWAPLRDALGLLRDLRADAVLIQDLGVLRLCRAEFPELTLHASTQMSLHTPAGIAWAADKGIRRVVLHREATLEEIRAAAATGVEIEVFAHGALCVSMSGQCALSASLGERSGNRGRCAQPCRLPYSYRGTEAAWLSPADLCALPNLRRLMDAGVASLKLEGRLKRPEYVYIVTDIYRRALDRLAKDGQASREDDEAALRQIFCRGRFTRGYAGGEEDAGILNPEHTAHEGVPIGQVRKTLLRGGVALAQALVTKTLCDQDGLTVGQDKCVYSGPEVPAGQTATLRLHQPVPAGTPVMRTESARQLEQARALYGPDALRRLRLPFRAALTARAGEACALRLEARDVAVAVTGPVALKAERRPLDEETVRQAMAKTGDAPFVLDTVTVRGADAYLSSAQLNALRREALAALEDAVISAHERPDARAAAHVFAPERASGREIPSGRWYVRTERPEEIPLLLQHGADHALLSLRDVTPEALAQIAWDALPADKVTLQLPPCADDMTIERLTDIAARHGLTLAADNAGQLGRGPAVRMTVEGVPLFNTEAERFLASQGVVSAVLSPELSGREIAAMPPPVLERVLCVYGRQRLMLLRHCPERVFRGLTKGHANCRLCQEGAGLGGQCLTDRKGLRLPLLPYRAERGCVVRLYSGEPVSLLPYMSALQALPCSRLLSFTDEPTEARLRILGIFRGEIAGDVPGVVGKYLTGVL